MFHAPAFSRNDEAFMHGLLAGHLQPTDPERAAVFAGLAEDFVRRSSNPMRSAAMGPLGLYFASQGDPAKGHALADDGFRIAAKSELLWTESMALNSRARIALMYDVNVPAQDLSEALTRHRQAGAWYAFKYLVRESLPWLHDRGLHDLAHALETNLRSLHRAEPVERDGRNETVVDWLLRELDESASVAS